MSYLNMMEATMPPGFRFHPRDEELVCDYLAKRINGDNTDRSLYDGCPMLISVDLNKCEPWDLPEIACVGGKEYYFYSVRDRKYATGQRTNRATISGYWKATGKDRPIFRKGILVGMRKTLVFYQGRAPKGKKTDWVMHEFRMESPGHTLKLPATKEDWVLCRVFYKSRGLTSKPITTMMNTTNYEDTIAPTSLPPLTETYITFNGYDQVPCFSHNQFQNNPMTMIGRSMAMKNDAAAQMDGLDQLSLNQIGCDKNEFVDVLNQLTKMEEKTKRDQAHTDHHSYGEGNMDSYFSENGGSNMW